MVDLSLFPSCGERARHADLKLIELLDPLEKPMTWAAVKAALQGEDWWAHATFDDPEYCSSEYGDFIIRIRECQMGYRTYQGGIEPLDRFLVRPEEVA